MSFIKKTTDLKSIIAETKIINKKYKYINLVLENDNKLSSMASFVKENQGRTITISVIKQDAKYKLNYIFCIGLIVLNVELETNELIIKSISSILKCSQFFQDEINKKYKIKFIEEANKKIIEKRIGVFDTVINDLDDIARFKYEVKDEIIKNVDIEIKKAINISSKNIDTLVDFYNQSTNNSSLVFSLAIEEIAKIEVSKKAKLIRVIAEELIRASSHLFNFSIFSHLFGCDNLMLKAIKIRETLQNIKEIIWNNKLDCNINIIGGVNYDIDELKKIKISEKLTQFIKEFENFYKMIGNDEKLNQAIGFGKISKSQVLTYGLTGPIARASFIDNDIRSTNPYLLYSELGFESKLKDGSDAYSRLFVRLDEILESLRLIRLSLELLPNENLKKITKTIIPKGEATIRIEAPRGELFYYLRSEGTNEISRIITRTPTAMNWQMLKEIIPNNNISQMPLLLNSIDPCISCSLEL